MTHPRDPAFPGAATPGSHADQPLASLRQTTRRWPSSVAASLVALGACADPRGTEAVDADSTPKMEHDAGQVTVARDAERPASRDAESVSRDSGVVVDGSIASARAALAEDEVVLSSAGRNVLYTWTTEEQARELRSSQVLLTRSERRDGTRTAVSGVLATLAATNDPLAKLLSSPAYQKGRFGWPSAWATVRGWPGESYGTALVRIVLKPQAWIVRLIGGRFDVVDLADRAVDLSIALASPERIAAVYFVSEGSDGAIVDQCGGSFIGCAPSAYREYFVNNERMVEEWSLATDTILLELERGRKLVGALRAVSGTRELSELDTCYFSSSAYCAWGATAGGVVPWSEAYYLRALALTSDYYLPTAANLDDLASALDAARFSPDPFVHRP